MSRKLYMSSVRVIVSMLVFSWVYALFSASIVGATSSYDSYAPLTTDATIRNSNGSCSASVGVNWFSILSQNSTFASEWGDTFNTGEWAVSIYKTANNAKWFVVNWENDTTHGLAFGNNPAGGAPGTFIYPYRSEHKSWRIYFAEGDPTCNMTVEGGASGGGTSFPPEYSNLYNVAFKLIFTTFDVTYPEGYAGEQIPGSLPPAPQYVALGDSFSSGEGNPPFEIGTENTCHRSQQAYPHLLTSRRYLDLTDFAACSGATTADINNVGLNDQIETLSQDTDIVTLTVGGNDVGFKDFATACTVSLCDFSTQAYQDIHDSILNALPSKLAGTYEAIDEATSSDAKVYVLGYPYLAPAQMPTGPSSACWPLNGGANNPDPTQNNGAAVYTIQGQLNTAIQQAVIDYGSPKFEYIDPNGSSSPFAGHDWCSQDRYFNQVTVNNIDYSYHPNALGQDAYASIMAEAVN